MINPETFAATTLQLLQADPSNYRNFGASWYFVKAVLKRFYTRDNLYMLGDYEDPEVIGRMETPADLQAGLATAIDTYQAHARSNLNSPRVIDPQGEEFVLADPDAAI